MASLKPKFFGILGVLATTLACKHADCFAMEGQTSYLISLRSGYVSMLSQLLWLEGLVFGGGTVFFFSLLVQNTGILTCVFDLLLFQHLSHRWFRHVFARDDRRGRSALATSGGWGQRRPCALAVGCKLMLFFF